MSDFSTPKNNHLIKPIIGGCPELAKQRYNAYQARPAEGTSAEEVKAIAKDRGWIK